MFVISFDESFNEELEKEQMDFIGRYFKDGEVKSGYLSSDFLGQTTAKDLKGAFEECTEKLDLKNLIQVSIDGPNINWKMLDLIVEDRTQMRHIQICWMWDHVVYMLSMEHLELV